MNTTKRFQVLIILLVMALGSFTSRAHAEGDDLIQYNLMGKIGKSAITAHFNIIGSKVTGFYKYDKQKKSIPIDGVLSSDGQLSIKEYGNIAIVTGNFNGKWDVNGVTYSGKWTNPDGSKSYDFFIKGSRMAEEPPSPKAKDKADSKSFVSQEAHFCDPQLPETVTVKYQLLKSTTTAIQKKINKAITKAALDDVDTKKWADMAPCKKSGQTKFAGEAKEMNIDLTLADTGSGALYVEKNTVEDGFAHPNGAQESFYISLTTGQHYSVKDLFTKEGIPMINALIKTEINKSRDTEMPADCSSNFESIEKNGNLKFSKESLEVYFAKDVLENNCGLIDVDVKIPMDKVRPALAPHTPFNP